MKIYYAHCVALYNTKQETRDIATLQALGFEVENPNDPLVEEACKWIREDTERFNRASTRQLDPGEEVMKYFRQFATTCDAIAFRALPDGSIPAGVAKEIEYFREVGKPVIELPTALSTRVMTVDGTREYLKECGYR